MPPLMRPAKHPVVLLLALCAFPKGLSAGLPFPPEDLVPHHLSVQAGPVTMGQSTTQTTPNPGEDFPASAEFSQPLFNGPAGIHLSTHGVWDLSEELSLKLLGAGTWGNYSLQIADTELPETLVDIFVGAFLEVALSSQLTLEAGMGYHSIDGVFFRYINQRTGADTLDLDVHALRPQIGIHGTVDALSYRFEAGQSFALHPTATHLGAAVEYELPALFSPRWRFHVGATYGLSLRYLTAPTHRTEVNVDGLTQALALTLRITVDPRALFNAPAPEAPPSLEEDPGYNEEGGLEL